MSVPPSPPKRKKRQWTLETPRKVRDPRFDRRWDRIMSVWQTLVEDSPTPKEKHFVFCGRRDEVVRIVPRSSNGLYSDIYNVQINGVHQPVVLKVQKKPEDENVPMFAEAELQMYASFHGFAPEVLWHSDTAILSEECTVVEQPRVKSQLARGATREQRAAENKRIRLEIARAPVSRAILNLRVEMFKTLQMYNGDPNKDNYMRAKNDKIVQIDFGQNRLHTRLAFEHMLQVVPPFKQDRLRAVMGKIVGSDEVVVPPLYSWYMEEIHTVNVPEGLPWAQRRNYMKQDHKDNVEPKKSWDMKQWEQEINRILDGDEEQEVQLKF